MNIETSMDWFDRLLIEYKELTEARDKLELFLSSPSATKNPHRDLLIIQYHAMSTYKQILSLRIKLETDIRKEENEKNK